MASIQRMAPTAQAAGRIARVPLVPRCTATVDPQISSVQQRQAPRSSSPRRGLATGTRPQRDGSEEAGTSGPTGRELRRGQGQGVTEKAPELSFLEDDDSVTRKATAMLKRYGVAGRTVVVRCLGRQGVAGAVNFLLALRALGAAEQPPVDFRFQMRINERIPGFGTPLILFVDSFRGRGQRFAPPPVEELHGKIIVARATETVRLVKAISLALSDLPDGKFVRIDMVGVEALFRGVDSFAQAREELGKKGNALFVVADRVTVQAPARLPPGQQQQEQQPAAEAAAATAAPEGTVELQVTHLYIGRTPTRLGGAAAATAAATVTPVPPPTQAPAAAPAPAAAEAAAAPAEATAEAGARQQISVPLEEWLTLKDALSSMMEQQQQLAQLLAAQGQAQQQAAAAAQDQGLAA